MSPSSFNQTIKKPALGMESTRREGASAPKADGETDASTRTSVPRTQSAVETGSALTLVGLRYLGSSAFVTRVSMGRSVRRRINTKDRKSVV